MTVSTHTAQRPLIARKRRSFRLQSSERFLLIALWLILFAVFAAMKPELFLRTSTVTAIFSSADVYVILGLAAMVSLYIGEFDLSIPYAMGLCATVLTVANTRWDIPIVFAVLLGLGSAALAGAVNAFFVVEMRVDPLITTLGTGSAFLGLSIALADSKPVSGLTVEFSSLASNRLLGFTATFWYGAILALVMSYVFFRTPTGRRMTFVGSNPEVARLAGVRVNAVRRGGYIWGSVIAGVAGVLLSAKVGGYDPSSGSGYLLPTFATVFVSAAVFTLGRFNPFGAMVGAYFIATGSLGLQLLGVSGWSQQIFYGSSLVLAVTAVSVARGQSVARRAKTS